MVENRFATKAILGAYIRIEFETKQLRCVLPYGYIAAS
jgi:hypothetical protein